MSSDWLLHEIEGDAIRLATLPSSLYERIDRVSLAVAAARDALLAHLTEEEIDGLRKKLTSDLEALLKEFDERAK